MIANKRREMKGKQNQNIDRFNSRHVNWEFGCYLCPVFIFRNDDNDDNDAIVCCQSQLPTAKS